MNAGWRLLIFAVLALAAVAVYTLRARRPSDDEEEDAAPRVCRARGPYGLVCQRPPHRRDEPHRVGDTDWGPA